MLRHKLLFGICLISLTFLAPGCGDVKKSEPAKPAKIVMYSPVNEEYVRRIAAEFEKDTGIKVEYVRLSAGEMIARVRAEKKSPKATVLYGGSADGYIQAKDEGLLEKYVSQQAAAIPSTMKDPGGYWTGVYIGYIGFVANQKLLTQKGTPIPSSWNDLLRPELKGQVTIANPGTAGAAYTMLATLVQLDGEATALRYMKKLHAQVKEYPKSAVTAAQMVGKGETTIGVAFLQMPSVSGQGCKYVSVRPRGTGYEIVAVGSVKEGPDQVAPKICRLGFVQKCPGNSAKAWVLSVSHPP